MSLPLVQSAHTYLRSLLRDRNLYLLLIASLVIFTLVYEWHTDDAVQVGTSLDRPYAENFREPVRNPDVSFRLTRKHSRIIFQGQASGMARRISITTRATKKGDALGKYEVAVNGELLGTLTAERTWNIQSVIADTPSLTNAYDWVIELRADDDIAVREVRVQPVTAAPSPQVISGFDLRYLVVPDWRRVRYLTLAVLLAYAMLGALGVKRKHSGLVAGGLLLLLAALMMVARMYLTLVTIQIVYLLIFCAIMVAFAAWLAPRLFRWGGVTLTTSELRAVLLVFFIALLVKYGGEFYPQFRSSDLLYHVHRLEWVMSGNLFFLTQSPEFGNQQIPLAPGFYVFLTPLTTLFPYRSLLLQVISVLFDASNVFLLFYLAKKFLDSARVGWLAGLVYSFTPITFLMLSAGNIPNIFSQWLLLLLFTLVLANYTRLTERRVWLVALFLFVVAGVSHLGNLIVMAALLLSFAALTWVFCRNKRDRRAVYAIVALVGAGIALSFLLYYSDFIELLVTEGREVLAQKFGGGLRVAGTLNFAKVPIAISAAVIGGGVLGALVGRQLAIPMFQRALLAWFFSAGVFVLAAQFVGVYVRYNIYVLPALSLGVGMGAVWLLQRLQYAWLPIGLFMGYVIWVGLSFWFIRVMYVYH